MKVAGAWLQSGWRAQVAGELWGMFPQKLVLNVVLEIQSGAIFEVNKNRKN